VKNTRELLNTKELKERFTIKDRQAVDKYTKKLYFCPKDLGFKFTFEDCQNSLCRDCWNEVKDYLEFRIKSEEEH